MGAPEIFSRAQTKNRIYFVAGYFLGVSSMSQPEQKGFPRFPQPDTASVLIAQVTIKRPRIVFLIIVSFLFSVSINL